MNTKTESPYEPSTHEQIKEFKEVTILKLKKAKFESEKQKFIASLGAISYEKVKKGEITDPDIITISDHIIELDEKIDEISDNISKNKKLFYNS